MDDQDLDDDASWSVVFEDFRKAVIAELLAEVAPGHPLHGREIEPVMRCVGCDDVLVRVGAKGDGLVHATWSRKRESLLFPRCPHTLDDTRLRATHARWSEFCIAEDLKLELPEQRG
ncbi:hypothetical protein [Sanguibacter suaedae]|uniref:Uncharacterized protein n=1 Tax=Sanguibacter suaedae TaxID=2795737 RepID=A0A934ICZ1_9MICO|nr:hypothetical protein [Sanguibacter suaedae]MBI9115673.1 hypothetical protein [Sanguibacter suaedae]